MAIWALKRSTAARKPILVSLLVAILLVMLASCKLPGTSVGTQIPQDSPEAVVHDYYDALNRGDVASVERLIDPQDDADVRFVHALKTEIAGGLRLTYRNVHVQLVENSGQTARLRGGADLEMKLPNGGSKTTSSIDLFSAVRKTGRWYLVGLGEEFPPGWLLSPSRQP